MIRLPATSISLSEHDVELHLDKINTYHSLLAQGFKTKDIARYYAEHVQQTTSSPSPLTECTPTFLDMVHATQYRHELPSVDAIDPIPASPIEPPSPQTSPPTLPYRPARHAPRHSSLLRFAKAISPEKKADDESYLAPRYSHSTSSPNQQHGPEPGSDSSLSHSSDKGTARKREEHQLEEELSRLTLSSSPPNIGTPQDACGQYSMGKLFSPGIRYKSPLSSPLRAEAADYTPQNLDMFADDQRTASDKASSSANTDDLSPEHQLHGNSLLSDSAVMSTPQRSSSVVSLVSTTSVLRADPEPTCNESNHISISPSSVSVPTLPPVTPTAIRRTVPPQTEPPGRRHQGLDGTDFTVYDDNLPAANQPQTPADLSRRRLITEHEAAYTAPPGRVLAASTRSPRLPRLWTRADPGEQSPTVRAMGIRERRLREAARSARLEEELWTATEDDLLARGWHRSGLAWRYGFEGDSVGEENFENAEIVTQFGGGRDVVDDRG